MEMNDPKERQLESIGSGEPISDTAARTESLYLNAREYQAVVHYLEVLTTLTKDIPLEAAIRTAKRANNLGPVLHPELHLKMEAKVENQIALMESLLWFQNEILNQAQAQSGEG